MLNFLFPSYRFNGITEIRRKWLKNQEIYSILLDVDCTLKYYSSTTVLPEIAAWLERKRNQGFQFCLLSNGRRRRIQQLADRLDLPFLAPAYKPLPSSCQRAMRMLHLDPQYTALIGDQVFTDVMAANLAGIRSILVKPLRPQEEPLFARVKRPLERFVLRFDNRKSPDSSM
ncbi:MAG: YqeG family HAD IIIA-type phosphatase [Planctomycetaceae bacterium]|nr:YqeG family HAD IIIA-type phosphatase [Planctomycetaceae bacterium]